LSGFRGQRPRLPPTKRLEIIKRELPKGTSQDRIAEFCGVTTRTIRRDIRRWRETGGFEEWLQEEFFRLHNSVRDEEEVIAYKTIARLLERTLTQKVKAEVAGPPTIIVQVDPLMEGSDEDEPENRVEA